MKRTVSNIILFVMTRSDYIFSNSPFVEIMSWFWHTTSGIFCDILIVFFSFPHYLLCEILFVQRRLDKTLRSIAQYVPRCPICYHRWSVPKVSYVSLVLDAFISKTPPQTWSSSSRSFSIHVPTLNMRFFKRSNWNDTRASKSLSRCSYALRWDMKMMPLECTYLRRKTYPFLHPSWWSRTIVKSSRRLRLKTWGSIHHDHPICVRILMCRNIIGIISCS